jgi:hypothetical protein
VQREERRRGAEDKEELSGERLLTHDNKKGE